MDARTFSFEKPTQEDSYFSQTVNGPTIIASALGIVVLAAILLVIRRQRSEEDDKEFFADGPPISQQAVQQPVQEENQEDKETTVIDISSNLTEIKQLPEKENITYTVSSI